MSRISLYPGSQYHHCCRDKATGVHIWDKNWCSGWEGDWGNQVDNYNCCFRAEANTNRTSDELDYLCGPGGYTKTN